MTEKMTKKDMVDSLLCANDELRRQLTLLQEKIEYKETIAIIALEGLNAIEEFGNSQEIAKKTLAQIKEFENNN